MKPTLASQKAIIENLKKEIICIHEEYKDRVNHLESELKETRECISNDVLVKPHEYKRLLGCEQSLHYLEQELEKEKINNSKLLDSLVSINTGVVKDLSQTIYNLTKNTR